MGRLSQFHDRLQGSVSRFALGREPSEWLMLKYYECMLRAPECAKQRLPTGLG